MDAEQLFSLKWKKLRLEKCDEWVYIEMNIIFYDIPKQFFIIWY